eukprot:5425070-Amphidinium_carterae.2
MDVLCRLYISTKLPNPHYSPEVDLSCGQVSTCCACLGGLQVQEATSQLITHVGECLVSRCRSAFK